jgi:hypothetical protein
MTRLAILPLLLLLGAVPLSAQEAARQDTAKVEAKTEAKGEVKVVEQKVVSSDADLQPLVEVHVGYAVVTKADDAIEFGASTEMNAFSKQYLRLVTGVDYMSTRTKREITGGAVPEGSFSDLGVYGDARLRPFRVKVVAPYLGIGLGLHFRSNDYQAADGASDDVKRATKNIADLYDGVGICAQGSVGVLVDGTESGAWGVSGDVRSIKGADVGRTSIRVGLFVRL